MFPVPFQVFGGSRLTIYFIVAAVIAAMCFGVYLRIQHLKHKVEVYAAQMREYKTAYEAQKQETQKANAAVAEIQRRYEQLSQQMRRLQAVHKQAVSRYQKLLADCMKRKPQQPVTIKVVEKEQCPKIDLKEQGDPLLERLNSLFEEERK